MRIVWGLALCGFAFVAYFFSLVAVPILGTISAAWSAIAGVCAWITKRQAAVAPVPAAAEGEPGAAGLDFHGGAVHEALTGPWLASVKAARANPKHVVIRLDEHLP